MTPTPWAQAVEAAKQADYYSVCGCTDQMHKPDCYAAMLRAALPHLLRAWIAGLTDEQLWKLGAEEWYPYDRKPNGGGMRAGVPTPAVMRKRLLAALTDAAGRVGG